MNPIKKILGYDVGKNRVGYTVKGKAVIPGKMYDENVNLLRLPEGHEFNSEGTKYKYYSRSPLLCPSCDNPLVGIKTGKNSFKLICTNCQ